MYHLRLFLLGWFPVGIVTIVFLYWLRSRTAATNKEGTLSSLPPQRSARDNPSQEVRAA
jgi:hypothetical protein